MSIVYKFWCIDNIKCIDDIKYYMKLIMIKSLSIVVRPPLSLINRYEKPMIYSLLFYNNMTYGMYSSRGLLDGMLVRMKNNTPFEVEYQYGGMGIAVDIFNVPSVFSLPYEIIGTQCHCDIECFVYYSADTLIVYWV